MVFMELPKVARGKYQKQKNLFMALSEMIIG